MNSSSSTLAAALFALILAVTSACRAEDPKPVPTDPPLELVAEIGGWSGSSYRVELSGKDAVIYQHEPHSFVSPEHTPKTPISIKPAQWQSFRKALDDAKVWSWKKEYINPNVRDGTAWKLKIKYADASIESSGTNDYPDKKQFEAFKTAVVALLGGKEFK